MRTGGGSSCVCLLALVILGIMPDMSPDSFKRTSLLLDAVIKADSVRHERGGSTGMAALFCFVCAVSGYWVADVRVQLAQLEHLLSRLVRK